MLNIQHVTKIARHKTNAGLLVLGTLLSVAAIIPQSASAAVTSASYRDISCGPAGGTHCREAKLGFSVPGANGTLNCAVDYKYSASGGSIAIYEVACFNNTTRTQVIPAGALGVGQTTNTNGCLFGCSLGAPSRTIYVGNGQYYYFGPWTPYTDNSSYVWLDHNSGTKFYGYADNSATSSAQYFGDASLKS